MYIRELHKRNLLAPTQGVDRDERVETPGGLVISEGLGLFRNVLVFDFPFVLAEQVDVHYKLLCCFLYYNE